MIHSVVAFSGIPLDSPFAFINGILLLLIVSVAIKAIFAVFNQFGRFFQ